jgi:hypothetical protein
MNTDARTGLARDRARRGRRPFATVTVIAAVGAMCLWCSMGVAAAATTTFTMSPKACPRGTVVRVRARGRVPSRSRLSEDHLRPGYDDRARLRRSDAGRVEILAGHVHCAHKPAPTGPLHASTGGSGNPLPPPSRRGSTPARSASPSPSSSASKHASAMGVPRDTPLDVGDGSAIASLAGGKRGAAALDNRYTHDAEAATLQPANLASMARILITGSGWLDWLQWLLLATVASACAGAPVWLWHVRPRRDTPRLEGIG